MKLNTQLARLLLGISVIVLAHCATPGGFNSGKWRSPSSISELANDRYTRDIQPIFSKRCVACHACIESPCQLNMTKFDGVNRGATDELAIKSERLFPVKPTRLKDGKTISDWRERGFFSVLGDGEHERLPKEQSLLYRFISRGMHHNQPGFSLSELDEYRQDGQHCVKDADGFFDLIKDHPGMAMPLGLPALDQEEFLTLEKWLEDGAPGPSANAVAAMNRPSNPSTIQMWEQFFNGHTAKERLTARYLYEHLFFDHIHFDDTPVDEFFEIVRSKTPPGQPIQELVTERPYDDPGVEPAKVYYRFKKVSEAIIHKTHVVFQASTSNLNRWRELFLKPSWGPDPVVDVGYKSMNPFKNFYQIPSMVRAQFMNENSLAMVDPMTRGPVCSGRTATFAVRDHFWIFFLKPESDVTAIDRNVAIESWEPLLGVKSTTKSKYLKIYRDAVARLKPEGLSPSDIWTGEEGNNPNAVLTIMRHEYAVSVHHGLWGELPKTIWVSDYANFERNYYNLVADYIPWGNIVSQLTTWTAMAKLRTEMEERFLSMLPAKHIDAIRNEWNNSASPIEALFPGLYSKPPLREDEVNEVDPYVSLSAKLWARIPHKIRNNEIYYLNSKIKTESIPSEIRSTSDWEKAVSTITARTDLPFPKHFPNLAFVKITPESGDPWVYTMVAHRDYRFNHIVYAEKQTRDPAKDTVNVFPGLVGSRPEIFFDIRTSEVKEFIASLSKVNSSEAWAKFKDRFAIRRNNGRFWQTYDWFTDWAHSKDPLHAGIYDLFRYEVSDQQF